MGTFTKKRCGYITEEQKSVLIDYMRDHPQLMSGKFSSTFTVREAQNLWSTVTDKLHQIPGALKTWQQWRKTWQDIRAKVKAKNTIITNHQKRTGGGPASIETLTQTGENVIELIGATAIHGHENIAESNVDFDWTNSETQVGEIECLSDDDDIVRDYVLSNYCGKTTLPGHVQQTQRFASSSCTSDDAKSNKIKLVQSTSLQQKSVIPPVVESVSKFNQLGTKRKVPLQIGASQRFQRSIKQTEHLAEIANKDQETHASYYKRKLELYERDVLAKEKIAKYIEKFVSSQIH